MFTLRLILYGLIAIVPSQNRDSMGQSDGFLALMVDTQGFVTSNGHVMPQHRPMVLVTEGELAGKRCSSDSPCALEIPAFSHFDFDRTAVGSFRHATGLRVTPRGLQHMFPLNALEAQDLSWVPALEDAAPGAGRLDPTCLYRPEHCRLIAAMRVWTGEATACHLVHYARVGDERDRVRAFWFKSETGSPASEQTIQAMADAIEVRIPIQTQDLSFTAVAFTDGTPLETYDFRADSGSRTLTMIVANLPTTDRLPGPPDAPLPRDGAHAGHFEAYYALSQSPIDAESRRVPREFVMDSADKPVMTCEAEMTALRAHVDLANQKQALKADPQGRAVVFSPPHSMEVCIKTVLIPESVGDLAGQAASPTPERSAGTAGAPALPSRAAAARRVQVQQGERAASPQPPPR